MQDHRSAPPLTVNEVILDESIHRAITLERLKSGESLRVRRFLDDKVLPDVLGQLQRLEQMGVRQSTRRKRLKDLFAAIKELLNSKFSELRGDTRKRIEAIGVKESKWMVGSIARSFPYQIDLITPNVSMIKAGLQSTGARGKTLGRSYTEWWDSVNRASRTKIMQEVNIGLASGESVDKIVRRVRGTRANRYRDGAWRTTGRHAEAVVRTNINHIASVARNEVAKANQDVIKAERWVSTLDSRTSVICANLDGRKLEVGQGIRPPAHVRCRSIVIPVTKSFRELGLNIDEPPPSNRASRNYPSAAKAVRGEVPGTITYGRWLRSQPVDIQNEVLGKRKAQLFRSGKVSISQFTDSSLRPLTLEQLQRKSA